MERIFEEYNLKTKLSILLIGLLTINIARTQGISLYPYIDIGYSVDKYNPEGLNQFHTTFNDFWGNELSDGWDQVSGNELSHPFFALGFRGIAAEDIGISWAIGYQYGKGGFKNSTTWSSSVVQRYHFTARHHQWTAHFGMAVKETFLMELYISATAKFLGLRYTTLYPDGSESIGTEYKLNDYYDGLTSALEFGPQFTYRKRRFAGYVRLSWPVPNFPPAKNIVTLQDYSSNHYPPTDFPANYTTYATDPIGFVENNDGVLTDSFEGRRITFGITWLIGGNKF